MQLPSGRRYSICVVADSLFDAAVAFGDYCNDPDVVHMDRPHVDVDAVLEVRPIFKVSMRKAMLKSIGKQMAGERKKKEAKGR